MSYAGWPGANPSPNCSENALCWQTVNVLGSQRGAYVNLLGSQRGAYFNLVAFSLIGMSSARPTARTITMPMTP